MAGARAKAAEPGVAARCVWKAERQDRDTEAAGAAVGPPARVPGFEVRASTSVANCKGVNGSSDSRDQVLFGSSLREERGSGRRDSTGRISPYTP